LPKESDLLLQETLVDLKTAAPFYQKCLKSITIVGTQPQVKIITTADTLEDLPGPTSVITATPLWIMQQKESSVENTVECASWLPVLKALVFSLSMKSLMLALLDKTVMGSTFIWTLKPHKLPVSDQEVESPKTSNLNLFHAPSTLESTLASKETTVLFHSTLPFTPHAMLSVL